MSLWSLCATKAQCMSRDLTQATFAKGEAGAVSDRLYRGMCWHSAAAPQRTFVLADLLNPGQRVHLHQCIGDADHMHHVHDALDAGYRGVWAVGLCGDPMKGVSRGWWGKVHMGMTLQEAVGMEVTPQRVSWRPQLLLIQFKSLSSNPFLRKT